MNKLNFLPRYLFTLTLVLLAFASPVVAQDLVVELDPAQSQVAFTLGATFHTVHGTFKLKRGTVGFDPASARASGLVVVDATSAESGNRTRDHKMHKDVLESSKYPEITFTPEKIQGPLPRQGDFNVRVLGTFTMHGGSHPLSLVVQGHITGDLLTADTHFTIPFASWGLKNPSTLFLRVSDTVDIAIHAVGQIRFTSGK